MNLDDLRASYQALDAKLDVGLQISLRALQREVESRARRERWLRLPSLLVNALALVWLGSFAYDQRHDGRYLTAGLVLLVSVAALLATTIQELVALAAIDPAAPVVDAQRRLATLRHQRIRTTQAVFAGACLLWALVVVVLPRGLLGLDLFALLGYRWLVANALFGLAMIPIVLYATRFFAARYRDRPWLQQLHDDLEGTNLRATRRLLDDLAELSGPK